MQEMERYQKSCLLSGCLIAALGVQIAPCAQADSEFALNSSMAEMSSAHLNAQELTPVQLKVGQFDEYYGGGGDGIAVSQALWAIMFEDGVQLLAEPRQTFTAGGIGANGWVIKRHEGDLSIQFKF